MKRKPTPAQIAARERFAEMARSGAFKKKAKRNPAKIKRNPISGQEAGEFRMTVNGKSVTRFFAHDNDPWANSYGFNYRLLSNVVKVGSPVRFTKTRAIVAIDEAADGSPVTETWEIRDLKFYKSNPRASNPIVLVTDSKPSKRKANPVKPKDMTVYQVQYRKPGMKLFEPWMTVMYPKMAEDIARRLADEPMAQTWTIKVESIKVKG